ncbi:MAG TPA: arsenite methyltransferase [Thermomicrobiales bacterium]|nr:arsenite methyltransferase [Thermomicrobiales bacterium]
MVTSQPDAGTIRDIVRSRYSEAANAVLQGSGQASCCSSSAESSCCGPAGEVSPIVIGNYDPSVQAELPAQAVLASLGCGNPVALAALEPGQVVLDLGSGGGIDVLLSARRVSPGGFAYGLDMTDAMLELAEKNKAASGIENASFLKGEIEAIPLPDASVDVIISNCVINLSADKDAVFREALRVLKPGGLFAVSDIVVQGEMDAQLRQDMESWAGCVAGALEENDYLTRLATVGFVDASIEVTKTYDADDLGCGCGDGGSVGDGRVVSGFVRARKQ